MRQPQEVLNTNDSMVTVMEKFQATEAGTLPILTPEGSFVGFVSKARLNALYRQIMKDFSEE